MYARIKSVTVTCVEVWMKKVLETLSQHLNDARVEIDDKLHHENKRLKCKYCKWKNKQCIVKMTIPNTVYEDRYLRCKHQYDSIQSKRKPLIATKERDFTSSHAWKMIEMQYPEDIRVSLLFWKI